MVALGSGVRGSGHCGWGGLRACWLNGSFTLALWAMSACSFCVSLVPNRGFSAKMWAPMSATSAENTPSPAPPRRRLRLVWRLLIWVCVVVIGLLLVAGGALYWAYSQRDRLVGEAITKMLPGYSAKVTGLDLSPAKVSAHQVSLVDPVSGLEIGQVAEFTWVPEWLQLTQGKIGEVAIRGLSVKTDAATLRRWLAEGEKAPAAAVESADSAVLPSLSIARADLSSLSIEVEGDERTPSLKLEASGRVEGLDTTDPRQPRLKLAHLVVKNVQVTLPDGTECSAREFDLAAHIDAERGAVVVEKVSLPGCKVHLSPSLNVWLAQFDGEPSSGQEASAIPAWLREIEVREASIPEAEIQADEGLPKWLGPLLGSVRVSYSGKGFRWTPGELPELGTQELRLDKLHLRPKIGEGGLRCDGASITLGNEGRTSKLQVDAWMLDHPVIEWTQDLEDALLGVGASNVTAEPASSEGADWSVLMKSGTLKHAEVKIAPTRMVPVRGGFKLSGATKNLRISPQGARSDSLQSWTLSDVSLRTLAALPSSPELISMQRAVLGIVPDQWQNFGLIDELTVEQPRIVLNDSTLPPAPPSSELPRDPGAAVPLDPWWETLHFNRLALNGGRIRWEGRVSERIAADVNVDITTTPAASAESGIAEHRLALTSFQMELPDLAKLPVAGVDRLEVVFRLPDVWKKRQIELVSLTGGHVESGPALSKAFQMPEAEAGTAPASTAATKTAPVLKAAERWRANRVQVRDLGVTLQKLAPGLPPVRFNIGFDASDTPLEPEGLAENAEPQRIELANLTIPSPYESLRTVARLDTIFINFTLEGLLSRRIDKVEIVSPTIYVGEDLFWYVDYYRKFAAGDIHSELDIPAIAAAGMGNPIAVMIAAETVANASQNSSGAWAVDTLQVHAGKLVLAPKGVPLPGFRQPFPFSFTTRFEEGKFDAEFEIPPDNYVLEDMKLEFRGMRGKVLFNLPFKTKDNNLNETFWVDQIRWKQMHMEKAHLSVTYDANGVYGKFGGEAYEGYIDGAFDIYNDTTYSWDGWISMTGVKSTEVTEKLFPSYFLLDGKINGTVVALGNVNELFQADVKFSNASPGRFSIMALNDMIKDFSPEVGAALTDQITRIGLETLRDFDYDKVEGEGRFYGREGTGHLKFLGPVGARNITVNVFDHRWKDYPKKTPATTSSDAAE